MTLKELYDVTDYIDYVIFNGREYHPSSVAHYFVTDDMDKMIPFKKLNKYTVVRISRCTEDTTWGDDRAVMRVHVKEC